MYGARASPGEHAPEIRRVYPSRAGHAQTDTLGEMPFVNTPAVFAREYPISNTIGIAEPRIRHSFDYVRNVTSGYMRLSCVICCELLTTRRGRREAYEALATSNSQIRINKTERRLVRNEKVYGGHLAPRGANIQTTNQHTCSNILPTSTIAN